MNDTIIGVIIGGIITILVSLIGFLVQYKLESYKDKKESQKRAYINAIKWFSRYGTSFVEMQQEATEQIWEDAVIGMNLYGSKEALRLFKKIENEKDYSEENIEAFKKQVKNELGFGLDK